MTGTFLITFDCEGKWGLADCLDDHHRAALTNDNLSETYQLIIDILNRYEIKGTFAFVGAFTMSPDEYLANKEWFSQDVFINGKAWLQDFRNDIARSCFEGWFNPKPIEMVEKEQVHEIAWHGFTHLPLAEHLVKRNGSVKNRAKFQYCR